MKMVEVGSSGGGPYKYLSGEKIESREYQEQIALKCVGKNSLVVIPTGLGKTIIAVLVSAKTLEMVPSNSKIIVLAPTRPLIDQHFKSFQKFLSIPEDKFAILTGRIPPGKRTDVFNPQREGPSSLLRGIGYNA